VPRKLNKRAKMPMLLMQRSEVIRTRSRKPAKKFKPRCDICEGVVNKIPLDHGDKKDIKTKRGRPAKKTKTHVRREHIGWYCKLCKIFFYPDGSPDWRGIT